MENFKTLLEANNKEDLQIFMKNSKIDLLKSIAKRYKLPISAKNKSQIIAAIVEAIDSGKAFRDEPKLAQMSVAQLKNKAVELNIDISGLKVKQALRVAILNKMNPTGATSASTTTTANYDFLKSKTLSYLKALAKQLKIKISKLSKEQLITTILEKTTPSGEIPELETSETGADKDLSKLTKNVLLLKATELGYTKAPEKKLVLKKQLIDFISSKMPGVAVGGKEKEKEKTPTAVTFPIQPSDLIGLKKILKVADIKELLKSNRVKIPTGVTKKDDLLQLLLLKIDKALAPAVLPPEAPTSPEATTTMMVPPTISEEVDIVSLDDIESPFVPVNVNDLTVSPTEDALSEDIMRCLKFYEHPS